MRRIRTYLGLLVMLGLLAPSLVAPLTAAADDELPPLADVPFYGADACAAGSRPGLDPLRSRSSRGSTCSKAATTGTPSSSAAS